MSAARIANTSGRYGCRILSSSSPRHSPLWCCVGGCPAPPEGCPGCWRLRRPQLRTPLVRALPLVAVTSEPHDYSPDPHRCPTTTSDPVSRPGDTIARLGLLAISRTNPRRRCLRIGGTLAQRRKACQPFHKVCTYTLTHLNRAIRRCSARRSFGPDSPSPSQNRGPRRSPPGARAGRITQASQSPVSPVFPAPNRPQRRLTR